MTTRANQRAARPKSKAGSSKRRLLVWIRRAVIAILASVLLAAFTIVVVLWYYGRDLPTVDSLRNYEPPQTTRVVDREGRVLGEIFTERRTVVPMERVPKVFVYSVLAAEDADFFEHEGLDYPGLLRALGRSLLSGDQPRGTSTITQQVVKLLLLSPERTMSRKIKELLLARRLEQELTKEEILHLYVNHINFGHGRYGVQEAARFYFGKDVEELTLAEASLLAGIPQSPTRNSPRTHPDAARRRQLFVLAQLEEKREAHWEELTVDEIHEARDTELELVPAADGSERAPEIVAMARAALESRVSESAFARGGFTIHTTIDLDAQDAARRALREGLGAIDERHSYRGPLTAPRRDRPLRANDELEIGKTYDARVTGASGSELLLDVGGHAARAVIPARFNPEDLEASAFAEEGARVRVSVRELPEANGTASVDLELGPQAAIVVIEPRSREILAMVGGYDTTYGFNRAVQARRQPGSTFKPIVYALGIKNRRFTPASQLLDAPTVFTDGYRPSDFGTHQYRGFIRVREAIADSVNACAINAINEVGIPETVEFARALGIESPLEPVSSTALGTSEVTVLELTNAYATFAAGGRYEEARWLDRIEGPEGRVGDEEERETRDVLSPAEAHVVTSMLESVVQGGTAREARSLGRPAAGKTGTSDEARDAWFIGYTPDLVAGVWVGFDDRRPLGRRESGARAALPIWMQAMQRLSRNRRVVEFPVPSGVVTARIDPASGLLAYDGMEAALEEVFVEGTAPTEVARSPDVADPDSFLMDQIGDPPAPGTTP